MKNRGNITISNILESDVSLGLLESQRNYSWKKEEADEFFNDLTDHIESEEGLFLGTIVINIADSNETKRELIVDGQQRITTISLFLIACRQRAKELEDERLARKIQQKLYFTDLVSDEDKKVRLEASPSINDLYQYIAKYNWDGVLPVKIQSLSVKKQKKLIDPVYTYFQNTLSNLKTSDIEDLLRAVYRAEVARIDVNNDAEALGVFERLNARGVGLVISDLLKNQLFREIPEEARENWDAIVDNSYGSTERMLKYFYVSQRGYIKKKELFRKLKDLARETSTSDLLSKLENFSAFYKILRSGTKENLKTYLEEKKLSQLAGYADRLDSIFSSIEALRLFKITQFYPLVYAALNSLAGGSLKDDSESAKKFVSLMGLLEKYHFINNMICERIGNEVEKPYAEFSKKFNNNGFPPVYIDFVKFISTSKASEAEFVPRFEDTWYSYPDTIPQLMYIFDRFSNEGVDVENRVRLFNPEQLKRRNHNIEHFYPQKPTKDLQIDLPKPENIDNIGNLLAISLRVNSKLQNKSPEQKVQSLNGDLARHIQNHVFVQEFLQMYGPRAKSWNSASIADRARQMAKLAYQVIWKI